VSVDRAAAGELVGAAAGGDQHAVDRLVEQFAGLVWSVARANRLADHDAEDVFQTTWLRLVEHLGRLRDPQAVAAWLATTARHESFRILRQGSRTQPAPQDDLDAVDDHLPDLDTGVLTAERDRVVWEAFAVLNERCQRLLRVLMADPAPSYDEVSAALDIPVGSIGPTRGRCLAHLREQLRTRGISTSPGTSG
jgi:RNA polymerase sigma factor (sigma-70 family)